MKNNNRGGDATQAERAAALARYAILHTPDEQSFDDLVRLACMLLDAPVGAIGFVDSGRCWFKSGIGLALREVPLADPEHIRAMLAPGGLVVPDVAGDPCFAHHPMAAAAAGMRFCAGELLETPEGIPLGALWVADSRSRPQGLDAAQRDALRTLARQVMMLLDLRRTAIERDAALEEQRGAEAFRRQLLDSAIDYGIVSSDREGRITSWNKGAENVLGWTEAEVLGQPVDVIFTPEDRADGRPDQEKREALEYGRASDERWHIRKDGRRFWASGELTPLRDPSGRVSGFVKILRDRTEQKASQAALEQANLALENRVGERTRERDRIWRNSLDLLLAIGADGVLRAVNPAWTTLLGYLPEDLLGRSFEPFVHPDDAQATREAIGHASREPLERFEVRLRHKDGSYRWLAWSAAPEDGIVYANGRDITLEKKQAALLAQASEARLQFALEAGEMGAWQWNIQSNESFWLHGMATVHGLAPGKTAATMDEYARLVHPEDRARVEGVVRQALDDRSDHRVEYRVIWPDGSIHWIEGRGRLFLDESGTPVQMAGICVDITRRKRIEHDLRFLAGASAELATLVDHQSTLDKLAYLAVPSFADWCAIDLLEDDSTLRRVAVAHADPRKVELAHELHRRFPPAPDQPGIWEVVRTGQAQLVPEITDAMLEQSIQDKEYLAIIRELGLRSYIGAPLTVHGRTLGAVTFIGAETGRVYNEDDLALAVDLARRAAVAIENAGLYRALQQSDRAKDVFLATLAHELRNPLAPISNAISIMKLAPDDGKRVEQSIRLMERQVSQLTRLVDDLMDISRITTGKIELRREPVSLASILNSAIETSRPHIEAAHHKLSVTLPGEATGMVADPVRLAQVFSNLLNNAAKYTNPGGSIDLVLDCQPGEFVVRVRDSGIGIAPGMLSSVFTIFTQVTHPLERSQGGLGIGLSLVKGLVELHGGSVEARSEGPGRGSEFMVRLPRPAQESKDAAPLAEPAPGRRAAPSGMRRILVVDDNVDAANTVAELLRMLGNEVSVVHDGPAALDRTIEIRPDIAILDIGLPGMDGYEVARRIRADASLLGITLIALTGWGQDADRQRAADAGFDHHWVKPVGLEQLQEISLRH